MKSKIARFKNWNVTVENGLRMQQVDTVNTVVFTKKGLKKFSDVMNWLRIHNIDPKEFNEFLIELEF
jgi:hypothetical protein